MVYNKKLASLYRDVLYTYQEQKGRLMTKLEQRLDAVARVKDTRQLIELQSRLHNALSLYFGIKSNFKFIQFKFKINFYLSLRRIHRTTIERTE